MRKKTKNNKGATLRLKSLHFFDEMSYKTGFIDQLSYQTKSLFDKMGLDELSCTPRDEVHIV